MSRDKKCISCGKRLKLIGRSEDHKIFQCKWCGLGVTVGDGHSEQNKEYHRDKVYIQAGEQFRNIFAKRVEIISKFGNIGRVLEVGSSTGLLLSLLKEKGWEVFGIEPSGKSSSVSRQRGIPTLTTTFELAELPPNSFDLIIFNHVLEHMGDLLKTLKKAHKVLKKEGLIFIDVPNFASLSARLHGVGWQYILPKEHRWHFTPTSFFLILEKAGFWPIYWEAHSGIWGYGNPKKELWDSFKGRKKRFFWNILSAIPAFILTKLKAGTGLTVVGEKVTGNK